MIKNKQWYEQKYVTYWQNKTGYCFWHWDKIKKKSYVMGLVIDRIYSSQIHSLQIAAEIIVIIIIKILKNKPINIILIILFEFVFFITCVYKVSFFFYQYMIQHGYTYSTNSTEFNFIDVCSSASSVCSIIFHLYIFICFFLSKFQIEWNKLK